MKYTAMSFLKSPRRFIFPPPEATSKETV